MVAHRGGNPFPARKAEPLNYRLTDFLGCAVHLIIYVHDDLMLYLYGLKGAEAVPITYHCIGAGPEWEGVPGGRPNGVRDGVNGRPGSRHEVYAPTNTSFDVGDVVTAFGKREPPVRAQKALTFT